MKDKVLKLRPGDSEVKAALAAEHRLNRYYGIESKEHYINFEHYGIRVRVCEYGEGEPLLIVPGNTGDGFPFTPLIAQLTGRRILVLNRPGGGLSEGFDHRTGSFRKLAVETLACVLDYFAIKKIPIAAHSMGAHWSLWFAMDRPERVERLVLLGVPGNVLNCHPPFALRLTSIPLLNRLLFSLVSAKDIETSLRGLSFMGHSEAAISQLPREMAECYYYFQKLPHYRVSSLSLMEKVNTLFGSKANIRIKEEELAGVKQPTMLIWGTKDPFGSVETGKKISEAIPRSVFAALPDGGHLPWLDDTAFCSMKINGFLKDTLS